jgi:predicted transcriptional regulator
MTKTLTAVRIKNQDVEALAKLAKKDDEPMAVLIRQAIREYLDRRLGEELRDIITRRIE